MQQKHGAITRALQSQSYPNCAVVFPKLSKSGKRKQLCDVMVHTISHYSGTIMGLYHNYKAQEKPETDTAAAEPAENTFWSKL